MLDIFNSFNSVNYFLNRVKPYNPSGRFQTEEESDQVSIGVKSLLDKYNISYKECSDDLAGYDFIVQDILNLLEDTNNAV